MGIWKFKGRNRKRQCEGDPATDETQTFQAGPGMGRVMDLLAEGKKVAAVKAYRELTGAGLREAKEAVELMEVRR
ncbi:ribosomal protein L7/L12 [Streptomyces oceani]|nr:ribosomal protein L7/L12 [Streptomyces oceani]